MSNEKRANSTVVVRGLRLLLPITSIFTTEDTEFHGGKSRIRTKTPCFSKLSNGQQYSVVNSCLLLQFLTTEDTEFHGGKDDFRIKNSVFLRVLRGFIL